ncbi:DUF4097 family beta strand repeat-containing protein [Nocardia carnea]|uniref:DUF4097 family beta strand repeat-containing protein n=1 Tax=Nocardia carnea TaxID=37328 RepID=A0ABW7TR94_9NOCA|nr:DUF4097 family beta strand repeat-containing protein [Nocardia carnea]
MPTFQTPAPIAVTVEVLSADVFVHATDRTETVVDIQPADASKKGDIRAAEQTWVDFTDGVLTVTTPKDWRTHTPFGGNPTIAVTIQVPSGSRLKSSAGVGRIEATGELGRSDLEIAAGDISIERAGDSVTARVAKGDIRIGEAIRGELRLETSMGELEIGISHGSAVRLELNAVQGSVHNQMGPADRPQSDEDTVRVYARNSYGNIAIRHATAA